MDWEGVRDVASTSERNESAAEEVEGAGGLLSDDGGLPELMYLAGTATLPRSLGSVASLCHRMGGISVMM